MPPPAFFSLPWRTSSAQTAGAKPSGGAMATIFALLPVSGPPPRDDSASSLVSFNRFLNALNAALICSGVGAPGASSVGAMSDSVYGWGRRGCVIVPAPRSEALSFEAAELGLVDALELHAGAGPQREVAVGHVHQHQRSPAHQVPAPRSRLGVDAGLSPR